VEIGFLVPLATGFLVWACGLPFLPRRGPYQLPVLIIYTGIICFGTVAFFGWLFLPSPE